MLYLWSFGDNIEDRFGPVKFPDLLHCCAALRQPLPSWLLVWIKMFELGASGAIAGVLGSYISIPSGKVEYCKATNNSKYPALIVNWIWIVLQLFQRNRFYYCCS